MTLLSFDRLPMFETYNYQRLDNESLEKKRMRYVTDLEHLEFNYGRMNSIRYNFKIGEIYDNNIETLTTLGGQLPYSNNYLTCKYAENKGMRNEEAVDELLEKLQIKDCKNILSDDTNWYQKSMPDDYILTLLGVSYVIIFYNSVGIPIAHIAVVHQDGHKKIIPFVCYSFGKPKGDYILPVQFDKPYPLFDWHYIAQKTDLPIYLTDSIELAWHNRFERTGNLWTSWLGEGETALDVRWDIIKKRQVIYVLTEHSGLSLQDVYKTAIKVYSKLKRIEGIKFEFYEIPSKKNNITGV